MYGSEISGASSIVGGSLAMTGLTVGSTLLLAAGLIMVGVTIYLLVRKNGEHRP